MAPPAKLQDLEIVFGNVVQAMLAMGGVALFIMLLTGGFKYLTSGGDPKALEGAKHTLTYAIGGFVLLAFSYMLLRILGDVTGIKEAITNFTIFRK